MHLNSVDPATGVLPSKSALTSLACLLQTKRPEAVVPGTIANRGTRILTIREKQWYFRFTPPLANRVFATHEMAENDPAKINPATSHNVHLRRNVAVRPNGCSE